VAQQYFGQLTKKILKNQDSILPPRK
jgi:hypothetical protein